MQAVLKHVVAQCEHMLPLRRDVAHHSALRPKRRTCMTQAGGGRVGVTLDQQDVF